MYAFLSPTAILSLVPVPTCIPTIPDATAAIVARVPFKDTLTSVAVRGAKRIGSELQISENDVRGAVEVLSRMPLLNTQRESSLFYVFTTYSTSFLA